MVNSAGVIPVCSTWLHQLSSFKWVSMLHLSQEQSGFCSAFLLGPFKWMLMWWFAQGIQCVLNTVIDEESNS